MTEKNEAKSEHKCEECQEARGLKKPYSKWLALAGFVPLLASWIYIAFILFSPKVEWHFAEGLLLIEVIGLAIVTFLFAFLYSILNVFGRPLYVFIDKDGNHVHLKPPSKDFQLENQVLKIWLGGWFRRNELDGPGSAAWQVPRAIIPDVKNPDEWRVTARDIHGQEITLNPWDLLSITSQRVCVDGMLTDHREKMEILDSIGFELVWMHGEILKDKKRLGRSKAVQKLRQDIEGILDNKQIRSSGLYAKWLQRVEYTNQVLAERKANMKRGNGFSDQPPVQA